MKDILKKLEDGQVSMNDVVFLSPKRYENSLLNKTDIQVNVLGSEAHDNEEVPIYATIQGFKGLDSKVVILFGMENVRDDIFSKYIYIAGTRARTLLYIVGSEEFWNKGAFS